MATRKPLVWDGTAMRQIASGDTLDAASLPAETQSVDASYFEVEAGTDKLLLNADTIGLLTSDQDSFVAACAAMGMNIRGVSICTPNPFSLTGTKAMANTNMQWTAVHVKTPGPIAGAGVIMTTPGDFVGNNNNKFGLHLIDPASVNVSRVAVSLNDANYWKVAAGSISSVPFITPYVQTGYNKAYYVTMLYCNSSQTTAPVMRSAGSAQANVNNTLAFPNSHKLRGILSGQTDIGSGPQAMSGVTSELSSIFCFLYG